MGGRRPSERGPGGPRFRVAVCPAGKVASSWLLVRPRNGRCPADCGALRVAGARLEHWPAKSLLPACARSKEEYTEEPFQKNFAEGESLSWRGRFDADRSLRGSIPAACVMDPAWIHPQIFPKSHLFSDPHKGWDGPWVWWHWTVRGRPWRSAALRDARWRATLCLPGRSAPAGRVDRSWSLRSVWRAGDAADATYLPG